MAGGYLLASCNTFESEPLEWNTDQNVVDPADSIANGIKGEFYAVYNKLPSLHTRLNSSYLDAATDDALATLDPGGYGSLSNYRNGMLSPANITSLDGNCWSNLYMGIRRANLFLRDIDGYPTSTQLTAVMMTKMIAEVRVLRAYFYFELMKRWGGVPIIGDEVIDYNGTWNIPRSSIDDVVAYIMKEISPESETSCYNDLYDAMTSPPSENTGIYGRMNKGVVLGLISRIKLYLASPLYNPDNNLDKWKEAAEAAKKVIDLNLYKLNPNFMELFGKKESFPNPEIIMVKEATSSSSLETNNSPCGYVNGTCLGLTSPSQNLVDAFLTIDGKTIDDPTSGYDPQNPYANRDPRLAYTVFCNGARWLQRPVETFNGGLDRNYRPNTFQTKTGYYLRKFLASNEERSTISGVAHHYYIIRYAEILLNYAEALNEVDPNANATQIEDCLIQIRKRAGINPGSDNRYGLPAQYTQAEMRKIIRNERRIEMSFEEQRFWDIRRWKIADRDDAVMMKPVRGVQITREGDGSFVYKYEDVAQSTFSEKMYWYPIARSEIQGNPNLTQNPGWNY
jgi:hypothetical protein